MKKYLFITSQAIECNKGGNGDYCHFRAARIQRGHWFLLNGKLNRKNELFFKFWIYSPGKTPVVGDVRLSCCCCCGTLSCLRGCWCPPSACPSGDALRRSAGCDELRSSHSGADLPPIRRQSNSRCSLSRPHQNNPPNSWAHCRDCLGLFCV